MSNNVFRAQFGKQSYFSIPGIRSKYLSPEELIKKICAEYLLMSPDQIKERTRKKEIVLPRQCIIKILFDHYQLPEKKIGELLSPDGSPRKLDHATINYSRRQVQNLMEVNDVRALSMMQSMMNVVGMRLLENHKQFSNKMKIQPKSK